MSTTTTNYKLIKPALTDAADITAMNSNWDSIDTALKNLGTDIDDVEAVAKAIEDVRKIKTYTHPTQFGSTVDATASDIYTALPANSIAILRPSDLTDSSWKLNSVSTVTNGTVPTIGMIEIHKGAVKGHGKIFFWGRNSTIGNAFKEFDNSYNPTGDWVKLTTDAEFSVLQSTVTALQSTVDGKQDKITGAASSVVTNNFSNTNAVVISNSNGKLSSSSITTTELNSLDGVKSNIQTQLDGKLGNSGDQEITNGSLKVTSSGDTAVRLDKTIDANNYVREYLILEEDRARLGFGKNGSIGNQISLYEDRTVLTKPLTLASGGTGASTAADALKNLGLTATATELNYVDGVTSKIQTQLDAKAENSKHRMTVYRTMTDLGLEASATFAETVAAVPNYTIVYLNAAGLTDTSWNLPVTYGIVQITRRDTSQLSIVLWGRVGNAWLATTDTTGVPSGEWNKVIEQNDLDVALATKQDTITGAISNVLQKDFTASRALVSQSSGKIGVSTTTSTELGYLSGVTSKVQTQLDAKMPKAGGTFTGNVTAYDTNRYGSTLRNISIQNSSGTEVSTNRLVMKRK